MLCTLERICMHPFRYVVKDHRFAARDIEQSSLPTQNYEEKTVAVDFTLLDHIVLTSDSLMMGHFCLHKTC